MMSSLLTIKKIKDPIMPLYIISFTRELSSLELASTYKKLYLILTHDWDNKHL